MDKGEDLVVGEVEDVGGAQEGVDELCAGELGAAKWVICAGGKGRRRTLAGTGAVTKRSTVDMLAGSGGSNSGDEMGSRLIG